MPCVPRDKSGMRFATGPDPDSAMGNLEKRTLHRDAKIILQKVLFDAIVCGSLEHVTRILTAKPSLAHKVFRVERMTVFQWLVTVNTMAQHVHDSEDWPNVSVRAWEIGRNPDFERGYEEEHIRCGGAVKTTRFDPIQCAIDRCPYGAKNDIIKYLLKEHNVSLNVFRLCSRLKPMTALDWVVGYGELDVFDIIVQHHLDTTPAGTPLPCTGNIRRQSPKDGKTYHTVAPDAAKLRAMCERNGKPGCQQYSSCHLPGVGLDEVSHIDDNVLDLLMACTTCERFFNTVHTNDMITIEEHERYDHQTGCNCSEVWCRSATEAYEEMDNTGFEMVNIPSNIGRREPREHYFHPNDEACILRQAERRRKARCHSGCCSGRDVWCRSCIFHPHKRAGSVCGHDECSGLALVDDGSDSGVVSSADDSFSYSDTSDCDA